MSNPPLKLNVAFNSCGRVVSGMNEAASSGSSNSSTMLPAMSAMDPFSMKR